eukprot:7696345-Ditylum_brightwellii.AAC.1
MTTSFGLGSHQNWHNLKAAVHRIGQGFTDRPSGCMFISDIILKCYSKLAVGHTITDPTSKFKEDKATLMFQVQSIAQMWGRL